MLHPDWKHILAHAWSVRFMGLTFVLTVLEVMLPLIQPYVNLSPVLIGAMAGLAAGCAFLTRIIAQKQFTGLADGA